MPRETFQEVFDRMEREIQTKQLEWSSIVEFFTKRGRPLSKDELQKLIEEDRKEREEEEHKKQIEEAKNQAKMKRNLEEMED